MGTKELDVAFEIIDSNFNDFDGPKTEEIVADTEKKLKIKFPYLYRCFLMKYGCGGMEGLEIYGIAGDGSNNSGIPDVVWINIKQRKDGFPPHLIVISDSGDGGYYAIDTSKDKGEIVLYYFGHIDFIADDFGCFLLDEIKTRMEW